MSEQLRTVTYVSVLLLAILDPTHSISPKQSLCNSACEMWSTRLDPRNRGFTRVAGGEQPNQRAFGNKQIWRQC